MSPTLRRILRLMVKTGETNYKPRGWDDAASEAHALGITLQHECVRGEKPRWFIDNQHIGPCGPDAYKIAKRLLAEEDKKQ